MVFPDNGIGARLVSAQLAWFVNSYYREKGVEVLPGELRRRKRSEDGVVRLGSGRTLEADSIVAGLGIEPATGAPGGRAAGRRRDRSSTIGIVSAVARRVAAGDVARFPAKALGKQIRVEHEDHANTHGRAVGANMAGADAPTTICRSSADLFRARLRAVGEVDSRLETSHPGQAESEGRGQLHRGSSARPRGFLLWDVWGKVDEARR
jgi:NADPH-dependent 2,4-dienoyl-CoA reductase/sulfur reductase-like enzyme